MSSEAEPGLPSVAELLHEARAGDPRTRLARVHEALPRISLPGHAQRAATLVAELAEGQLPTAGTVYLTGNCSLHVVRDGMVVELADRGIAPTVEVGAYDQWTMDLLEPTSPLHAANPSVVVLYLTALGVPLGQDPDEFAALVHSCLEALRARSAATTIVVLPDPREEERDPTSGWATWRRAFVAAVHRALPTDTVFVDPATVISDVGASSWYAPRYWHHAKLPSHPVGAVALGRRLGATVAAALAPRLKVVVADLDNTIWGGIVGEDGWAGLDLDVEGAGGAYLRLQALLLDLRARGFVLCAVSKNNEADVREVFERRPEMLLRWEDFSAVRAGWGEKSDAIAQLAKDLNLGLDTFCFLDDSPFERAEVRARVSQVVVPELPARPEDVVAHLAATGLFETPVVTAEDRARSTYYATQAERSRNETQAPSLAAFLQSLALEATARPVDTTNIDRVVQLIHKTNQFNLRTLRDDLSTVQAFAADAATYAYSFAVRDRFGNYGTTGVLVAEPAGGAYELRHWLLSCRVMGRTVEHAMFVHLWRWLAERGVTCLEARYRATPKNQPVAGLLPSLGFEEVDETAQGIGYRLTLGTTPPAIEHVRMSDE